MFDDSSNPSYNRWCIERSTVNVKNIFGISLTIVNVGMKEINDITKFFKSYEIVIKKQ
jgi:hypothetical protein